MVIMYCKGICVPLNPVQIPFWLCCVYLTRLKNRKGATVFCKNEKISLESDCFSSKSQWSSSHLSLCFYLVPTGGTLTPNKILLHLLRKILRGCTHQARRKDKARLGSPQTIQKYFGFWTFLINWCIIDCSIFILILSLQEEAVVSMNAVSAEIKPNQM